MRWEVIKQKEQGRGKMNEWVEKVWKMVVDSNLLSVIGALLVLLLGWFLATIISRAVRDGLLKVFASKKVTNLIPEEQGGHEGVAKLISSIIYYLILLFAVVGCLSVLDLSQAADPIQHFIKELTGYLPNLIGATLLIFIAYLVAKGLKIFSATLMRRFKVDEKTSVKSTDGKTVSATISEVIYWTTFLFFLPAVLSALKIQGITEPLQQMLTKITEYIPHLLSAAAILFFGLFAAKIVKNAVVELLSVAKLDELGNKVGTQKIFGDKGITSLIGIIAYVLVAIPVITAALHALKIDVLTDLVGGFFDKMLDATANLIGAGLLILAAFIIGGLVSGMLSQLLDGFGFNKLIAYLGFSAKEPAEQRITPAAVVGKLAFVAIMLFAAISACEMLDFNGLAEMLQSFTAFGGNIIIAVIVMMIGIFLANLAAESIRGKGTNSEVIGFVIKITVWIFTGAIAIHNLDIGGPIVQTAFTLLLGAVCVALALAFGIGGREFAAGKLQEWNEKLKKR